jgi:hypothetical protein
MQAMCRCICYVCHVYATVLHMDHYGLRLFSKAYFMLSIEKVSYNVIVKCLQCHSEMS